MEHQYLVPVLPARDLQLPMQTRDAASCLDVMLSSGLLRQKTSYPR